MATPRVFFSNFSSMHDSKNKFFLYFFSMQKRWYNTNLCNDNKYINPKEGGENLYYS